NEVKHPKAVCVRHAEGASAVRSVAKHRSVSVARSTPTLWAKPTRARPKKYKNYTSKLAYQDTNACL
ncbi:MAG: hypothetical protein NZ455_08170, partial [Bacteroidia bacterium]|nr:hypothetical protein [Bacteroidia bacterium]